MKANQLRIGNLVTLHDEVIIVGISDINAQHDCDAVQVTYLQPIPLDEDWLLKLGFLKEGITYLKIQKDKHGSTLMILWDKELSLFKLGVTGYWYQMQYVHQLQNLYFALTGEELKLKS